ncbi:hypothetical protein ACFLWA_12080 [Chloroflexota bacterium]
MTTVNFWLEVEVVTDTEVYEFKDKEAIKVQRAEVNSELDCIEVMKDAIAYDGLPDCMGDPEGRSEWEGEQLWRFIQDKTQQEAA